MQDHTCVIRMLARRTFVAAISALLSDDADLDEIGIDYPEIVAGELHVADNVVAGYSVHLSVICGGLTILARYIMTADDDGALAPRAIAVELPEARRIPRDSLFAGLPRTQPFFIHTVPDGVACVPCTLEALQEELSEEGWE